MARKVEWALRIPAVLAQLRSSAEPTLTVTQLASAFAISPRRAQQIFQPLMTERVGVAYILRRQEVIQFLERTERGDACYYEGQRRRQLAGFVQKLKAHPRVLVEAPIEIIYSALDGLPGVKVAPGQILVEGFETAEEACQKLLALAIAIGNDPAAFARHIQKEETHEISQRTSA